MSAQTGTPSAVPAPIVTARLVLRPFTRADLDELARISADPRNRRYMVAEPIDREQVAENLRQWMAAYPEGHGFYAVVKRASGRLIGQCGFTPTDAGELELGYMLDHPCWGRGYATEAVTGLLARLPAGPAAPVVAFVDRDNAASIRVLEKAGFRPARASEHDGRRLRFERPTPTS